MIPLEDLSTTTRLANWEHLGTKGPVWQEVSSSIDQQLGDINSQVHAEKTCEPLSKNDVFHGKRLCFALLSASVSAL